MFVRNQPKQRDTQLTTNAFILLEFCLCAGKRVVGDDGEEGLNDMYHENQMLTKETQNHRTRIKAMQVSCWIL